MNCKIKYLEKLSKNSDITHKHAAALIYNNDIISTGINKYVSYNNLKQTIHAEINATINIKKIKKHNKISLDLIVIRSKNNILKNSRPCNNCIDRLVKLKIRKVYYSNEYGLIVSEFVNNMEKIHISSATKYFTK